MEATGQSSPDLPRALRRDKSPTRVVSGDVGRNIEMNDDVVGSVAADQLNPQKSRALLQLCLATGMDASAIQDAFYRY